VILRRLVHPNKLVSVALAVGVFFFAQRGLWPVAVMLVLAVELWGARGEAGEDWNKMLAGRVPMVLAGMGTALVIAVAPRLVTQVVVAGLYTVWRWWVSGEPSARKQSLPNLLVVQAVVFEALFLMAAEWQTPEWLVLLLVWTCSYLSVYSVLVRRGERAAAVMAATWALVAAEISWVLLRWLFVYTVNGGYLLVPQPALVLTALAYCFGSIYASQREGKLSRARLTEYLLIGLILIAIVITGTPWKGTL
jgi:hypothetical protein